MATITRPQVRDKAKLESLIEERLNDITPDRGEIRAAAKMYFTSLIQEDLDRSDDVILNSSFDSAEGVTMGFTAGYEAALRARGLSA